MTRIPNHPDPLKAAAGVMPRSVDVPQAPAPVRSRIDPSATLSDLARLFPGLFVLSAWFDSIPVGTVAAPSVGASYWYLLRRWIVGRDTPELGVQGVYVQMLPTDYNGIALSGVPGDGVAWGDARGMRAALVCGVDLGIQPGAWTQRRYDGPGVEAPAGVSGLNGAPDYIFAQSFPAGNWGDAIPSKPFVPRTFAPGLRRVPQGRAVDVALVVNGAQIAAASGTGKYVFGYARTDIVCITTRHDADFST